MQDSVYDSTTTTSANESLATANSTGITLTTGNSARNGVCGALTYVYNGTTGNVQIGLGNFTQTGCTVKNATLLSDSGMTATTLRYTYSYTYDADNDATDVINDTTGSIAGVTDWFDIFIVIGAMVVLILLTVIIITAIRSSGMVSGGATQGANQVGTA